MEERQQQSPTRRRRSLTPGAETKEEELLRLEKEALALLRKLPKLQPQQETALPTPGSFQTSWGHPSSAFDHVPLPAQLNGSGSQEAAAPQQTAAAAVKAQKAADKEAAMAAKAAVSSECCESELTTESA